MNELTSIHDVARYLLMQLREPIAKKVWREIQGEESSEVVTLANLSELMFSYAAVANVIDRRQFIYDLEKCAIDKMVLKDKFTAYNSTKLLWGLAKFHNRKLAPGFNSDPASCLLSREHMHKYKESAHKLFELTVNEITQRKKS